MNKKLLNRTKDHYDGFPFIEGGSNRVDWWKKYLQDLLPDEEIADQLMVDVGSSVGEISRGLIDRKARLVCLDLSLQSLRRCRHNNPEAKVVNGNALELPFPDGSFDHAISIGVLHHTPDCRKGFKEVARITAPGGTVVIFLYNFWSIYNVIYHAFWPIRALIPLERVPKFMVRTMQPFVKLHLGQKLNDQQLRHLLGDKLWTPQATFHSVSQVKKWGIEEGLTHVATKRFFLGYANVMKFKKDGESEQSGRREAQFKCLECGSHPMKENGSGYVCGQCDRKYVMDEGVVISVSS